MKVRKCRGKESGFGEGSWPLKATTRASEMTTPFVGTSLYRRSWPPFFPSSWDLGRKQLAWERDTYHVAVYRCYSTAVEAKVKVIPSSQDEVRLNRSIRPQTQAIWVPGF